MDFFNQTLVQVPIRFCPTKVYRDGQQNGHRLSVCSCGHSKSVICYRISNAFHIRIASIKLSFMFEYWLCLMNENKDGRKNDRRLCVRCCDYSSSVIFKGDGNPNDKYVLSERAL